MPSKNPFSFALKVKEEIASSHMPETSIRPFLSAFIKCNGTYRLGGVIDLSSESSRVAKLLYQSISSIYGVGVRFSYTRSMNFRKAVKYHCLVDEADFICSDLDVDFLSAKPNKYLIGTNENLSAYLAGCFVSVGSVNDPKSSNYHLELALSDPDFASFICKCISKIKTIEFTPKIIKRRQQYVVYLKRSVQISDFLSYIGATSSCLEFENVRVGREMINIDNRLENLDLANMEKTLFAASRQIKEIDYLKEKRILDNLPYKVRVLADIRKNNPEASLEELASILSETISSQVSKSNINHILRKIHEEYINDSGDIR